MKRYSILMGLCFCACAIQAQQRQHVANFSQFQQYYNPALTGYTGSSAESFYRDQWRGFDDAPRTLFLSGQLNLSDINPSMEAGKVQHAVGMMGLYDAYGAARMQLAGVSYSAGMPVYGSWSVRAGATLAYSSMHFNQDDLVFDEGEDLSVLNRRTNRYGADLGVAVARTDAYVGYTLANALGTSEGDSGTDHMQHIVQAGYRRTVAGPLGLIVNGMYVYDETRRGIWEAQLKAVLWNTFWVGGGYRDQLAYTVHAGVRIKQLTIGYSREIASENIDGPFRGGNEIMLKYNLVPVYEFGSKVLSVW